MNSKKIGNNTKLLVTGAILIPVIFILIVIIFRNIATPSNEDIINNLKNINYYSTNVEYTFTNSKSEFKENTIQYYSKNNGMRIEFENGLDAVKVYKGGEIKVEGNSCDEFTLDKDIDIVYPLAFLENIFSNPIEGEIENIKSEWGDTEYIKVNMSYKYQNKHLDKAEFYIDKSTRMPALLKIYDADGKQRILITYNNFKKEKELSEELF